MKNNYSNNIILFLLLSTIIVLSLLNSKNIVSGFTQNKNNKISVVVPCIPRDVKHLDRLMNSIKNQTYKPHEIVIAMSGQSDIESEKLKQLLINKHQLPIKFSNVNIKQYASENRNRGAKNCSGNIISFMDADDVMYPDKLLYVNKTFNNHHPKIFIHGYSKGYNKFQKNDINPITFLGSQLYDIAEKQRTLGLDKKMHHGHTSIVSSVINDIKFREGEKYKRGQDCWFIRDVIKYYGRNDNTAVFIDIPLSQYVPAFNQK